MSTYISISRMFARGCGVLLIILGVLFWTGNALFLVPVHFVIGLLLVITLWEVAVIALVQRRIIGLPVVGLVWGVIVIALGATQQLIMPGSGHIVVQVIHLLVGLLAIGFIERIGRLLITPAKAV